MMDRIVCRCHRKTLGEIIETVNKKNCKSSTEIGNEIGAGTGCGGCVPMLDKIIEIENKRKSYE